MSEVFRYRATVLPEWIDYNGHMQDAFYGLMFSHAVDAFQDAVGFDAAYRAATGCTIYLVEDHKFFLAEVKSGQMVDVATRLIGVWEKRFHLWSEMSCNGQRVAVAEMMQLHVSQQPSPHSVSIPDVLAERLGAAIQTPEEVACLSPRARGMGQGS